MVFIDGDAKNPATKIFPFASTQIAEPSSLPVPPIVIAHCALPAALYLTRKASLTPTELITNGSKNAVPL